ncbi:structural constituent of cuticle [Desmophyllum pertusum]|uniref:Structural constituent of cuticle n=1 Tax=Desmophyllum pertusum TaxID=174260 RepID=A0A9X0D172_9CNID|nr:structural constituent of cuticle [Desmophyllum pertusum]
MKFVCKAVADVAFIVDSSGSIGRRNWVKMLQFLKDMVKAFNVGPDKTHIAVVAYSTGLNSSLHLTDSEVVK